VVAVLALNLLLSFMTAGRRTGRGALPALLVTQVEDGNVEEISSRAASIEGQLKREATYDAPATRSLSRSTKFKTEIPASSTLPSSPSCSRARTWSSTPSRPTRPVALGRRSCSPPADVLLSGSSVWSVRRQAGGGGGVLGAFGRSPARR
jgi:hypothetical protein